MRVALLVAALMLLPGALALGPVGDLDLPRVVDVPAARPGATERGNGPVPEPEPEDYVNGYVVRFNCPSTDPVAIDRAPCPYRHALEGSSYGAPSVIVDPRDPKRVLVSALVGKPVADGATRTTRDGGIVLLASDNEGIDFRSIAVTAPSDGFRAEDAALAVSPDGRVALASLWSKGAGAAAETVLAVHRLGAFPGLDNLSATPSLMALETQAARHARMSIVAGAAGEVFVAWQEYGIAADERSELGPSPYARVAWSTMDSTAGWNATRPVGPCNDLTNVVATGGFAFFGCTLSNGYLPDERALVGDLAFHRLDPAAANLTFRSRLNFGGQALLTVGAKARIAVASVVVEAPERVRVYFSTGKLAENWSRPVDSGRLVHNKSFGPVMTAGVHALAYQPVTDAYYLVYAERPQRPPQDDELLSKARERKYLVALDAMGQLLSRQTLKTDREGARLHGTPDPRRWSEPVAEDTRDGMFSFMSRPFVVYSDAGTLVYGELMERDLRDGNRPAETTPSEVATDLSLEQDRPFTPQFILTGVLLAGLVVGRALIGRFQSNTIET